MKAFWYLLTVLIFVAVSSMPAAAADSYLLEYNVKPGSVAVHKVALRGLTTTVIGEREQKIDIDTELYTSQAVESVSKDGKISIVTSIDSGQSKMNGEITVPENVGSKYKSVMTSSGRILELTGTADQTVKQMQMEFPDKPVEIGYTWKNTTRLPQGIEIEATYEFAGIETISKRKCAKIKSIVKSIGGGTSADRTYVTMNANGVIHFDIENGVIVKNVVTSFMNVKMMSSFGNQEQAILTKLFMTMTMTLQ